MNKIYAFILLMLSPSIVNAATRAVPSEYSSAVKIELIDPDPDERYDGKLYSLDYDSLIVSGLISSSVDPRKLKLFNNGVEQICYFDGQDDAKFNVADALYFYGTANTETSFTYQNVYWLIVANDNAKRAEIIDVSDKTATDKILTSLRYERNQQHQSKFGVDEPWCFRSYVYANYSRNFYFNVENVNNSSSLDSQIKVQFFTYKWGTTQPERTAYLSLNGHSLGEVNWSEVGFAELLVNFDSSYLQEGSNTLKIQGSAPGGNRMSLLYLNFVELDYPSLLELQDGELEFVNNGSSASSFELSGAQENQSYAFALNAKNEMALIKNLSYIGTTVKVSTDGSFSNRYIVTTKDKAKENASNNLTLKKVAFSDLRSTNNQADYLIIYWSQDVLNSDQEAYVSNMYNQLSRLVDYRSNQGLTVKAVTLNQIYNEFGAGIANPQAIKDFCEYAYNYWQKPRLSYLLLVGDADFDYREDRIYDGSGIDYSRLGTESYKQIPTHMFVNKDIINNSGMGETATDDWFVCFGGINDVMPELAVGRLPARDSDELKIMIDKIINFENMPLDSEHLSRISLIAGSDFEYQQNSTMISEIAEGYSSESIYAPATSRNDIKVELNRGSLFVNYAGHGSIDQWALNASISFSNSDVADLYNREKYQIYTALSCLNSYLIYPTYADCLAEKLIREENAGAVAMFASSGVSLPSYQRYMALGFYDAVFNRNYKTLGAAVMRAKLYLANKIDDFAIDAAQSFLLLGDPALQIPLPIVKDIAPEPSSAGGGSSSGSGGGSSGGSGGDSGGDSGTGPGGPIRYGPGHLLKSGTYKLKNENPDTYVPRPPDMDKLWGTKDGDPFSGYMSNTIGVSHLAYLFDSALMSGEGAYETGFGVVPEAGTSSSIKLDRVGLEKKVLKEIRVDDEEGELSRMRRIERSKNKRMELVRKFFKKKKQGLEIPEEMKKSKKENLWQRILTAIKSFFRALFKFVRGLF